MAPAPVDDGAAGGAGLRWAAGLADVALAATAVLFVVAGVVIAHVVPDPEACGVVPHGVAVGEALLGAGAVVYAGGLVGAIVVSVRRPESPARRTARMVACGTLPAVWLALVVWAITRTPWFCF